MITGLEDIRYYDDFKIIVININLLTFCNS